MEYGTLCGIDPTFYLEIKGIKLDVSEFTLTDYGFSKQHLIELMVYCPLDKLSEAYVMWQKATLVINKGLTKQYFHGVIIQEITQNIPAPKGYLASRVRLASHFWWKARTTTHCQFHNKTSTELSDLFIEASGLPPSCFKKTNLDPITSQSGTDGNKKLRMGKGESWQSFINQTLSEIDVHTRSIFNDTEEVIEFVGNINRLKNHADKPRELNNIEPRDIDSKSEDVFYELTEKHELLNGKACSSYQILMPDAKAYPGEWLKLKDNLFQVISIEIKGTQGFTFDNAGANRISKPKIISCIDIKKPKDKLISPSCPELKKGFSVYTGRIETRLSEKDQITRDIQGNYFARFDSDAPINHRASRLLNPKLAAKKCEAIRHVKSASISSGAKQTIDMPMHSDAEVILLKIENADEPAVILGAVNNARSKRIALSHYNILRTRAGNQLQFRSDKNQAEVTLETYKHHNALKFNNKTGQITLQSQKGNIILDAKKDFLIHTPATIALKFKQDASEKIQKNIRIDAFKCDIQTIIKHRAYLTAFDLYKIEVQKIMLENQNGMISKASNNFTINCEELILNAKGSIEVEAKKINITTEKFIATTPGSSINIEDNLLDLRAKNIVIDIKEAAHSATKVTLGSKPKTPKRLEGYEKIKETPRYKSRLNDIGKEGDGLKEIYKGADSRLTKTNKEAPPINKQPSSLAERIKQKHEKDTSDIINETIDLEHNYTRTYEDKRVCWMNKNKGELELKVKAKGVGDKFQAMLGSVQNRNELKRKVEDLVAKAVSDKTEMTLNKEGKLTLTTKIPSLENYNFNLEVGLDPQTLLPYAGASVTYEFYAYKLQTKNGPLELTGSLTLKNTFTPYITTGICEVAIPAARGLSQTNNFVYNNKENAAAIVVIGGLFGVGAPVIASAGVGIGLISFSTLSSADVIDKLKQRESLPYLNDDETIKVTFQGHPLKRNQDVS